LGDRKPKGFLSDKKTSCRYKNKRALYLLKGPVGIISGLAARPRSNGTRYPPGKYSNPIKRQPALIQRGISLPNGSTAKRYFEPGHQIFGLLRFACGAGIGFTFIIVVVVPRIRPGAVAGIGERRKELPGGLAAGFIMSK